MRSAYRYKNYENLNDSKFGVKFDLVTRGAPVRNEYGQLVSCQNDPLAYEIEIYGNLFCGPYKNLHQQKSPTIIQYTQSRI